MARWPLFWRRTARKDPALASTAGQGRAVLPFPKDINEIRRLDRQHFYLRTEMQGNYLAPLEHPTAILDVGCGTGRWAMEMATVFPDAQVCGFDIVPPTPEQSLGAGIETIPPNVRFFVADAAQPLQFADASFDFVYMRLLYGVLPAAAWEPLLREAVRVTRPGGWIESLEALPFVSGQSSGMGQIIGWFAELLRQRGVDPMVAAKMPRLMRAAGLQSVTEREINQSQTLPGQREQRQTSGKFLIENTRGPAIELGIVTAAEYDKAAKQAHYELATNPRLAGFNTYVTFGQRPV
jgi:ubiquinone/menaquinone biosynthesis C-methylase UbiE